LNAAVNGDVIYVDVDIYPSETNIQLSKKVTIIGAGSGKTIFDGGNSPNYFLNIKCSDVILRNIGITKYFSDNSSVGQVLNVMGAYTGVIIENTVITDCYGAGSTLPNLYISGGANVAVRNSFFKCSGYNGARGGGILVANSTLFLENTVFKQSQNTLDYGGGVKIDGTSNVKIKNCSFYDCIGQSGGGAIGMSAGTLSVSGSCFSGNISRTDDSNSGGGAIFITSGTAAISNCSFSNNKTTAGSDVNASTTADGGAIRIKSATVSIDSSSFSSNVSGIGSGTLGEDIAIISGTVTLNQLRFESIYKTASSDVNVWKSSGTLAVSNCGEFVNASSGVAITKPEITGTINTITNSLSPSVSPTTNCISPNIINCGLESPSYCQTETNPPVIIHCVDDKIIETCSGTVPDFTKSAELAVYEFCGYSVTQSLSTSTLISDLGNSTNPVVLTVKDTRGNTSTCNFNVIVTGCECIPTTAPIQSTNDITVQLDPFGSVTISASQIDNGTLDACQTTTNLTNTLSKNTFSCSDIGL
ncbi:MAG: hypothetical protein EB100_06835, partial [Crocinitomicaceae bacterium]|nr:hypothetical protein [Crocinitomicaceae bacterium]